MYFRQYWTDPRLKFNAPKWIETIDVSTDFTQCLWVPDTFFPNEKKAYYHTATTPNEMLRISKNGDVLRSLRLEMNNTTDAFYFICVCG